MGKREANKQTNSLSSLHPFLLYLKRKTKQQKKNKQTNKTKNPTEEKKKENTQLKNSRQNLQEQPILMYNS